MQHTEQRKRGDKDTRRIEGIFYRIQEVRQAVAEARADNKAHGRTGDGIKDPTGIEAVDRATELPLVVLDDGSIVEWPERWLMVYNGTYQHLDGLAQKIFTMRYVKRQSWKQAIADNIGSNTFYLTLREIILFAKMAACQLGVMRVLDPANLMP